MNQLQRLSRIKPLHDAEVPILLATKRYGDSRGWFSESYNERVLSQYGINCPFVQDNQSMSAVNPVLGEPAFVVAFAEPAARVAVALGGEQNRYLGVMQR